jgi:hypothetical protein
MVAINHQPPHGVPETSVPEVGKQQSAKFAGQRYIKQYKYKKK